MAPREGRYIIVPPPSRTIFARALRFFRGLLGAERLVQELTEQRLELNRSLNQLKATNQELKNTLAVRDRFFELVSHELRTPLNGIVGIASALAEGEIDGETIKDFRRSAERMRTVIEDMLELAKARNNAIEPRVARVRD